MPTLAHLEANKTRILIMNDGQDCGAPYAPLFQEFGKISEDPNTLKLQPFTFKMVVFTGGADISPELYGDTSPKNVCHTNPDRDTEEVNIYRFAQQRGIKMAGICRGMQFLNVMTGGKMMHDISGHGSGSHKVMSRDRDDPFLTNSFHHQMCIPHKSTHLLAWSNTKLSREYIGDEDRVMNYVGPEVEAIYMPWLKGVGVQWHPEATPKTGGWTTGTSWFRHLINDLLEQKPLQFRRLYLGDYSKLDIVEVN